MDNLTRVVLWKLWRVHPGDVRNCPRWFSSYRGLSGVKVVSTGKSKVVQFK